jgi:hypothetical protein
VVVSSDIVKMAFSPKDMDGFLPLLSTTDTKAKLTIAMNLINYLGDPDNTIECSDIGLFIDSLVPWMQSSNNKVCAISCIFETSSWFILFDPHYSLTILYFLSHSYIYQHQQFCVWLCMSFKDLLSDPQDIKTVSRIGR